MVKSGVEMDMRGRCSAGQKVQLAKGQSLRSLFYALVL